MKTLVIYPGRFHPFHKGHASVYNSLASKFGAANVFIATSNVVKPPKSPFTFEEKKMMMELTGVPSSAIVQTKNPYQAQEVVEKYDPTNTILLFAVSDKDMAEDPRFAFKPKKDGSPSYFQPAGKDMSTLDKHGYIITVPTLSFKVLGKPMKSATEFRSNFAQADTETQKEMITDLFGKYDSKVHELMSTKITERLVKMDPKGPKNLKVVQKKTKFQKRKAALDQKDDINETRADRLNKIIDEVRSLHKDKLLTREDSIRIKEKLEQLSMVTEIYNNKKIVESLYSLDREDIMNSEVLVQGVGRYTISTLMKDVASKLKDLSDEASKNNPDNFKNIKTRLDSGILQLMVSSLNQTFQDIENIRRKGGKASAGIPRNVFDSFEESLRKRWHKKLVKKAIGK